LKNNGCAVGFYPIPELSLSWVADIVAEKGWLSEPKASSPCFSLSSGGATSRPGLDS
ncbi:unnamed protein product, partial [marine sediment metagenome]